MFRRTASKEGDAGTTKVFLRNDDQRFITVVVQFAMRSALLAHRATSHMSTGAESEERTNALLVQWIS